MFDPARGDSAAEYLSSFLRMLSCKELCKSKDRMKRYIYTVRHKWGGFQESL